MSQTEATPQPNDAAGAGGAGAGASIRVGTRTRRVSVPFVAWEGGQVKIDATWRFDNWKKLCRTLRLKMPPSTEDDWQITPHGATLSEALYRSPELSSIGTGKDVLELGGGLGNQTVLMWRQNPRSLTTTEVTEARAATLRASLTLNGCGTKPSVVVADWLRVDVPTPDGKVDVVITNPPFAASGKFNRRYFIDMTCLDAHRILRPGGYLVFIQSSAAGLEKTLNRLEENGYVWQVVSAAEFPWRDYYLSDPGYADLAAKVEDGYRSGSDGRKYETLHVIKAQLLKYEASLAH